LQQRSDRLRATGLLCIAGLLSSACGATVYSAPRDKAFARAVEGSVGEEWEAAAGYAQHYLSTSSPEDPRYDRALMLLAQASESLGLSYAAGRYYLDVASMRRDVDQLDKAFAGLERIVMADGAHDADTIVRGFLATDDVSGISRDRQAFIDYLQGRQSISQGLDEWADKRFARIPKHHAFAVRGRYVQAVRMLARGDYEQGKAAMEELAEGNERAPEVRLDAELALARLAMDEQRYDDAAEHYEALRPRAKDQPELLLEMAWAQYYRGDSRRSLGLLIALDAPVYGGLIAPERYLLEARLLRRLCQFQPARTAAVRLQARHGDALADLHAGVRPAESQVIRAGARARGGARPSWRLHRRMLQERAAIDDMDSDLGDALSKALRHIYDVGIEEAKRREESVLAAETERLARELMAAEDGVQLILHELSVGLLRGRRRPTGPDEIESVTFEAGGDNISYRFVGEFWTDELDDLVVVIPDRCLDR